MSYNSTLFSVCGILTLKPSIGRRYASLRESRPGSREEAWRRCPDAPEMERGRLCTYLRTHYPHYVLPFEFLAMPHESIT